MMHGTVASCPICKKKTAPREHNECFPFCSPRCKTVDLGKWLNEDYRVPVEEESDEVQENPEEKA